MSRSTSTQQDEEKDNNEDLSYFRIPIVVPAGGFALLSLLSLLAAVLLSIGDPFPSDSTIKRGFLLHYGSTSIRCNGTSVPRSGLPSLLFLFERNVLGNIFFRLSVCIPMALRAFQSFCMRGMIRSSINGAGAFVGATSDLLPVFALVDCVSLALFSIVTFHSDFPEINRLAKIIFVLSSTLNIFATTMVMFSQQAQSSECVEKVSLGVKMMSGFLFCYVCPQWLTYHQMEMGHVVCHPFVARPVAIAEYSLFLCYALFHICCLVDIRHLHFLVYPLTASGETEALDPKNFEPGGRYERCRPG